MTSYPVVDIDEAPEGFKPMVFKSVWGVTPNKCYLCDYYRTCQMEQNVPPCRPDTRKDKCSVVFKRK